MIHRALRGEYTDPLTVGLATKRIDRTDGEKYPVEVICQLTERLTEDK